MVLTLEANGDAAKDCGVAGLARIGKIQWGDLKSGDTNYVRRDG